MSHREYLLGSYGRSGQEFRGREEELEMERQQIPDKDMIPAIVSLPYDYCQDMEIAHIRVLNNDEADL